MAICKRMSHILFTDRRVYVRPPSPDKIPIMVIEYPHGADGCKDILSEEGIRHYTPYRQNDDRTPHSAWESDRAWSMTFLSMAMCGVPIPRTEIAIETRVWRGLRKLHRVEYKPVLNEDEVYVTNLEPAAEEDGSAIGSHAKRQRDDADVHAAESSQANKRHRGDVEPSSTGAAASTRPGDELDHGLAMVAVDAAPEVSLLNELERLMEDMIPEGDEEFEGMDMDGGDL